MPSFYRGDAYPLALGLAGKRCRKVPRLTRGSNETQSGSVSVNTLIILVAVYVALFANTALFARAFDVYGGSAEEILLAASLIPFMAAIFVLVLSALCHRAGAKPVLIAFLLLSSLIATCRLASTSSKLMRRSLPLCT